MLVLGGSWRYHWPDSDCENRRSKDPITRSRIEVDSPQTVGGLPSFGRNTTQESQDLRVSRRSRSASSCLPTRQRKEVCLFKHKGIMSFYERMLRPTYEAQRCSRGRMILCRDLFKGTEKKVESFHPSHIITLSPNFKACFISRSS